MSDYIIIADDLTGANASGCLIKKLGIKTVTMMKNKSFTNDNAQAIAYSTDSRSIPSHIAYERVYRITEENLSGNIKLFNKRIDSTLRGNIGAEIDGMLDAYTDKAMAIVVPSFPASGRQCVGGYLMVNGHPLECTDVAKDLKTPVHTSIVKDIINQQTKYQVASINLDVVLKGDNAIRQAILKEYKKGIRIVVLDATTYKDIDSIAYAVHNCDVPFITVDPGPFTAAVIKEDIKNNNKNRSLDDNILMVVGSVTSVTRKQLENVSSKTNLFMYSIDVMKLLENENAYNNEISKCVIKVLDKMKEYKVVCVTTTNLEKEYRLDLYRMAEERKTTVEILSKRINDGLATITKEILDRNYKCNKLFCSGGDVTVAICQKLEADALELIQEVYPLAVHGIIQGGKYSSTRIITKGGLIGDNDGISKCINNLKKM